MSLPSPRVWLCAIHSPSLLPRRCTQGVRGDKGNQSEPGGNDGTLLEGEFHRTAMLMMATMRDCREGQAMALQLGLPHMLWKVPMTSGSLSTGAQKTNPNANPNPNVENGRRIRSCVDRLDQWIRQPRFQIEPPPGFGLSGRERHRLTRFPCALPDQSLNLEPNPRPEPECDPYPDSHPDSNLTPNLENGRRIYSPVDHLDRWTTLPLVPKRTTALVRFKGTRAAAD